MIGRRPWLRLTGGRGARPRGAEPGDSQDGTARKKTAAVITVYRPNSSHADVMMPKLLEGYDYQGRWREPRLDIVSMCTDQTPENDLSCGMAAKHGVPMCAHVPDGSGSAHPWLGQARRGRSFPDRRTWRIPPQ